MIKAIGIDSVEIERFDAWKKYSHASLLKIFSASELAYALSNQFKTSERLAARFAAKEASYKAFSSLVDKKISFLSWCKYVEIVHGSDGQPVLTMHVQALSSQFLSFVIHVSITHTKTVATALVIIE